MSNPSEMEPAEGSRETVDESLEEGEEDAFGLPADQMPEEAQAEPDDPSQSNSPH